jgi:hypothetical protein
MLFYTSREECNNIYFCVLLVVVYLYTCNVAELLLPGDEGSDPRLLLPAFLLPNSCLACFCFLLVLRRVVSKLFLFSTQLKRRTHTHHITHHMGASVSA